MVNCKEIKNIIVEDVKKYVKLCDVYEENTPKLLTIQVGDDEVSKKYIKNKIKLCNEVGIKPEHIGLTGDIGVDLFKTIIENKISDKNLNGIMIQLPANKEVEDIIFNLPLNKDVDGLGLESYKSYVYDKENTNIPCTARGVLDILRYNNIDIKSKVVLVIGKGKTSGSPISLLFQRLGATVININSNTTSENLHKLLESADIVISCAGKPILNYENMKHSEYQAIINVGMNNIDGKVIGDIDVDSLILNDMKGLITPVLGGTGILTVANLLLNTCIQHYLTIENPILKDKLNKIIEKYINI